MKTRKNLERAIVLGLLLSTSVYGNAWAAEFNKGLNYDVGGLHSVTINDEVKQNNGVYSKEFGNEDVLIKSAGINLNNFKPEIVNPRLTTFSLSTAGNIVIEKNAVTSFMGGVSDGTGAITVDVGNDINGTISAKNLNITNKLFTHDGQILGINLSSYNSSEASFTINIDNKVTFKDFNQGIGLSDDTYLEINAKDFIFETDRTKFASEKWNNAEGIYIDTDKYCKTVNDRELGDAGLKLSAENDIVFENMDRGLGIKANNTNVDITAKSNIELTNNDIKGEAAIEMQVRYIANEADRMVNNKNEANLAAGEKLTIKNYEYGIKSLIDPNAEKKDGIGSDVNLYSNTIEITNTNIGISATDKENNVKLDDYEAYNVDDIFERNNINTISSEKIAVFAGNGGGANINGAFNNIESDTYRTIHASGGYDGVNSKVNINGAVEIVNKNALTDSVDNRIAVVASADENSEEKDAIGGIVNVNLNGTDTLVDTQGNFVNGNRIVGSVIAGKNGIVNINSNLPEGVSTLSRTGEVNKGSIAVYGNVMAGNNGELNLDLGEGGYLSGRVDDYQDAAVNGKHEEFFNPEFSNKITDSGIVNLTMGKDATWDVTGQSWVTKLDGSGTIDMRNGGANDTSHAVHIGELSGSHTFVMDLDVTNDHLLSDMLFIKDKASGEQKLWINSINGLEKLEDGDRLRFATVNDKGLTFSGDYTFGNYGNAKNGIMLMNNGVLNNAFIINSEKYVTDSDENLGYNGDTETESGFDAVKPGDVYVDNNYKDGTNWFLEKYSAGDEESDTAKTIVNMSKVNYNNAIYMDRLNKRLGEARYINPEEEQGMWVRIRHDRIGKDDAFRSQNTMYEMGYDEKQDCDNGERRIGFAVDYMDGKAEYTNISGSGDVKRYGLWLYDTWLGDKGHYTDYVLKWGHLENDFDIYTMNKRENVTGDFSNNVFSVSAEYGKKNDMGSGWYFEPQAQLQLARVTGADYTTSQGSKVSLDGINSLIGRAGFRLGRDLGERSTVYVKADVLHEFLGDQDVMAMDKTTGGEWTRIGEDYENEGTWYDVGFGFATALSDSSYAFMDFEKSFGNDNDETYQINAGVQWTF